MKFGFYSNTTDFVFAVKRNESDSLLLWMNDFAPNLKRYLLTSCECYLMNVHSYFVQLNLGRVWMYFLHLKQCALFSFHSSTSPGGGRIHRWNLCNVFLGRFSWFRMFSKLAGSSTGNYRVTMKLNYWMSSAIPISLLSQLGDSWKVDVTPQLIGMTVWSVTTYHAN